MRKKVVKKGGMGKGPAVREDRSVLVPGDQEKGTVVHTMETVLGPVEAHQAVPVQLKSPPMEEGVKLASQIESVTEQAPAPDEKTHEFLGFMVSGEEYGLDIMMIKEIIRAVAITYVPRVPDYIKGIISLRGTVVPIFDMAKCLGLKGQEPGKKSRIVVVAMRTNVVGFWVDTVTEVVRLEESSIEPPPPILKQGPAEYIRGVGRFKSRMIIIMDVEKTFNTFDSSVTTSNKSIC